MFSSRLFEQKSLPFLIINENVHSNRPNLLLLNIESFSQLDFLSNNITRAIKANRAINHKTDEMRRNGSLITEKVIFPKKHSKD